MEYPKYVTIAEFLKMKPYQQCQVTHLDLSLATDEELAKMRSRQNANGGKSNEQV